MNDRSPDSTTFIILLASQQLSNKSTMCWSDWVFPVSAVTKPEIHHLLPVCAPAPFTCFLHELKKLASQHSQCTESLLTVSLSARHTVTQMWAEHPLADKHRHMATTTLLVNHLQKKTLMCNFKRFYSPIPLYTFMSWETSPNQMYGPLIPKDSVWFIDQRPTPDEGRYELMNQDWEKSYKLIFYILGKTK